MPNADEAVTEQARRFIQNSKRTLQELEDFNIDLLEPRTTLHPARRDLTHHENMRFIKALLPSYNHSNSSLYANVSLGVRILGYTRLRSSLGRDEIFG